MTDFSGPAADLAPREEQLVRQANAAVSAVSVLLHGLERGFGVALHLPRMFSAQARRPALKQAPSIGNEERTGSGSGSGSGSAGPRGCSCLDGRSRRMQATAGLASRWIFWFRIIGVAPNVE